MVAAVKEHPILMSAPMVRALLDRRKTQTRRIIKQFPPDDPRLFPKEHSGIPGLWLAYGSNVKGEPDYYRLRNDIGEVRCTYGKPGDRLWLRETFGFDCLAGADECNHPDCVHYRADISDHKALKSWSGKWKPSIFMPRILSRLTLEVTEVRVQRLQDISEEDALAEGCRPWVGVPGDGEMTAVQAFVQLWESLNGEGSWARNPWVWTVSFRVVPHA